MRLLSLDIAGFKSFAKPTTISFAPGVTAVVGPNGCGKSNIVDALRWVLGEQRSSVLRGDRMDNVIFNGTALRKPAGLAEVGILLDNSAGMLNLVQSEVGIARRLHRDGTSEYLLNGHECRLKDITDLLHDSGMGPNLYSILELKMVEDILREDGDGRRMLFEEAAGIAKYKIRRRQAQQKLKQTEEDLLRLSDILAEVERQVSSLKRQAMRARKFNELSAEARNLELALMYRDFRRLQSEMLPLEEALRATTATSETARSAIRGQEARIQELRAVEVDLERQAADLRRALSAAVTAISTLEAEESGLRSRIESNRHTIERVRRERDLMGEKRLLLEQRRQSIQSAIATAEEEVRDAQARVMTLEREFAGLETAMHEASARSAEHAALIAAKRQALAERQGKQATIAMERTAHLSKRELLLQDSDMCDQERQQIGREMDARQAAGDRLRTREEELHSEEVRFTEDIQRQEATLRELDERLRAINAGTEAASSKLDLLETLESKGPRAQTALKVLRSQPIEGLLELVGDTIDVDEQYRRAVHAALGPAAYYYLTTSMESAIKAIEVLRRERAGQTTFVSLADVPRESQRQVTVPPGTHGTALSLLRNGSPGPVAEYFLGHVVIVEDWAVALEHASWAREHGVTLITLDGQWISADGVIFGGAQESPNPVDLGLTRQIAELRSSLSSLQNQRESVMDQVRSSRTELAVLEQKLLAIRQQIAQVAGERMQLRESLLTLETRRRAIEERLNANASQIAAFEDSIRSSEASLTECATSVLTAESEVREAEAAGETLTAKLGEAQRAVAEGRDLLHAAERDRDAVRHRLDLLIADDQRLEQSLIELDESLKSGTEQAERAVLEMAAAERSAQEIEQKLIEGYRQRDDASLAVDRIQTHLDEARNDVAQQEELLRAMRDRHANELDGEKQLELELARLQGELNALLANAKTQLGLDFLEPDFPEKQGTVLDLDVTPESYQECRQRIERLGVVNPLAIEEHQRENERLERMTAQRDDLLKAKQTLEETIARINETAQARFLHTFEAVRTGFQRLFQEFFVGGEADLILSGTDLLEADITLWANPSGKRLKSLSLMSGGEKTMTAIALLFALYQVKPSPFCVFDEVDAPLDDANIDRFTRMIRMHSDQTQFILVTHNRRTMEIADNLYGVTMEEEGITKLVSVRLLSSVV